MLQSKTIKNFLFTGAIVSALFTSCSKNQVLEPLPVYDCYSILSNISEQVITTTYNDLHERSILLTNNVELLQSDPSSLNLEATRLLWRETQMPW